MSRWVVRSYRLYDSGDTMSVIAPPKFDVGRSMLDVRRSLLINELPFLRTI